MKTENIPHRSERNEARSRGCSAANPTYGLLGFQTKRGAERGIRRASKTRGSSRQHGGAADKATAHGSYCKDVLQWLTPTRWEHQRTELNRLFEAADFNTCPITADELQSVIEQRLSVRSDSTSEGSVVLAKERLPATYDRGQRHHKKGAVRFL